MDKAFSQVMQKCAIFLWENRTPAGASLYEQVGIRPQTKEWISLYLSIIISYIMMEECMTT